MTDYPTDVHGPASAEPHVTDSYAVCRVCGVQWQVRSDVGTDAMGCAFCGASARAVVVHSEAPGYEGDVL